MKKLLLCIGLISACLCFADDTKILTSAGVVIKGDLIFRSDELVIIQSAAGKRFQIPQSDIEWIGGADDPIPQPKPKEAAKVDSVPVMSVIPATEAEKVAEQPTVVIYEDPIQTIPALDYSAAGSAYQLAKVSVVGGILVFAYSQPVAKYTILGDIVHQNTPGIRSNNYNSIRNSLVSQAKMASREVDGIIIKDNSATLIKFDPEEKNKGISVANKMRGMMVLWIQIRCSAIIISALKKQTSKPPLPIS